MLIYRKRHWVMDYLVAAGWLLAATLCGVILCEINVYKNSIIAIYLFAVLLIAKTTTGLFPGIISSFVAICLHNYIFMEPHLVFNIFRDGNFITLMCMLAISIMTTMLVTACQYAQVNEIRQIKQNEQERADNEIRIEKEQMHSNLLRSISHDLRTPLTGMVGCARTIMDNYNVLSAEQVQELCSHIVEDGSRMRIMVENVLMITKAQGDLSALRQQEDVADLIGMAVVEFRKIHPDINIITETPEDIVLIPVVATLIRQVLLNVMRNSVDHGEHTTTIWIKAFKEDDHVVFTLEDDGVGFADHHAEQEPMDGKSRNMGIGLECCRAIVRAHGGKSGHCNRPEGGAFTHFTLPLEA